jgi:hypothetical protein
MPPPPARAGNVAAIVGLVCGALGCVPFVTGVAAVIFSIVGLRKSREPGRGGRGIAIAGLVLGIVSVAGWGLFGGGVWALVAGTAEVRTVAKQFVWDVGRAKTAEAAAACDPAGGPDRAKVEAMSATLAPLGELHDVTVTSVETEYANGVKTASIGGRADFAKRAVRFRLDMIKRNEQWKVKGAIFAE